MEQAPALRPRLHSRCLSGRLLLLFCLAGVAFANEAVIEYDTSLAGQIVPVEETTIEVLDEGLTVTFERVDECEMVLSTLGPVYTHPLRAVVTASYRLHNPGTETRTPLLAFPIVRGGPEEMIEITGLNFLLIPNHRLPPDHRTGVKWKVTLDEQDLPAEYVSFESLFDQERTAWAASVRQWLSQWPEILKAAEPDQVLALLQETAPSGVGTLNTGKGRDSDEAIRRIGLDKYQKNLLAVVSRQRLLHPRIEDWDLNVLSFLNAAVQKDAASDVAQFLEKWKVDEVYLNPITAEPAPIDPLAAAERWFFRPSRLGHRIDFLQYRPEVPAGETVRIEVRYSHLLDVDLSPAAEAQPFAPPSQQFQYILKTSSKWSRFGPIRLTLSIPCDLSYSTSLPVEYVGEWEGQDHYRYETTGSGTSENLLIGILENRDGTGLLPGDPFPLRAGLREEWEKIKAAPDDPFLGDRLYRLAIRTMQGEFGRDDLDFLSRELGDSATPTDKTPSNQTMAIALLHRPLERYGYADVRRWDCRLMSHLFYYTGENRTETMIRGLANSLQDMRKSERAGRWNYANELAFIERSRTGREMSPTELKRRQKSIRKGPWMQEKKTLFAFQAACDRYLAAYPGGANAAPAESRATRMISQLARLEIDRRLDRLPKTSFTLADVLGYDLDAYAQAWTIYSVYRDVPESEDLLRVLAAKAPRPTASQTMLDRVIVQDLIDQIRKEAESRGIGAGLQDLPVWLGGD
ncbi:hypothetical protein HQ520_07425 [bacterium]|nr:hypothetical protein [bacterium]